MSADEARHSGAAPVLARVARIALWVAGIALVLFILNLLGVPVSDWIRKLFKEIGAVPPGAIVGGIVLETVQTTLAAVTWVTILRAAFPETRLPFRQVLACYAVAVGLNAFLPANIGTLVMMLMFVTLIAAATFASIVSGFIVQKIPFTVLSVLVYVYLFATVRGSLSLELGFVSKHPGLTVLIVLGALVLLVLVGRFFWQRATKLREQVKAGGAVLGQPKRFMVGVTLPAVGSFGARLGITAVFLAGFSIPVTFHTVMAVTGANSISSSVSVTPGGVGVYQALNVVVLGGVTSSSNATAYSLAQQLIVSAWDVLFAVVLVASVFGWAGGKQLVRESYDAAGVKERELREQRRVRREAHPRRWRPRRSGGEAGD
jgi:uncharacterized membrane protein YbhN (UPF0104 family)